MTDDELLTRVLRDGVSVRLLWRAYTAHNGRFSSDGVAICGVTLREGERPAAISAAAAGLIYLVNRRSAYITRRGWRLMKALHYLARAKHHLERMEDV